MTDDPKRRAEQAKAALYQIGVAKAALLDALRIAEAENLRWIAALDKLCAKTEIMQRRFGEQCK